MIHELSFIPSWGGSITRKFHFVFVGNDATSLVARINAASRVLKDHEDGVIQPSPRSTLGLVSLCGGSEKKRASEKSTRSCTSVVPRPMALPVPTPRASEMSRASDYAPDTVVGATFKFDEDILQEIDSAEYTTSFRSYFYAKLGPCKLARIECGIIDGFIGGVPDLNKQTLEDTVFLFLALDLDDIPLKEWKRTVKEIHRNSEDMGDPKMLVLRPQDGPEDVGRHPRGFSGGLMSSSDDLLHPFFEFIVEQEVRRSQAVPLEMMTEFEDIAAVMSTLTTVARYASETIKPHQIVQSEHVARWWQGCFCRCLRPRPGEQTTKKAWSEPKQSVPPAELVD